MTDTELKATEAAVQADVHAAITKLEAELKAADAKVMSVWHRYDVWFAVFGTLLVGLIVGYHLHP